MTNSYNSNDWPTFDNQYPCSSTINGTDESIFTNFNNSSDETSSLDYCGRPYPRNWHHGNQNQPHVDFISPVNRHSMRYSSWPTRQNPFTSSESVITPSRNRFDHNNTPFGFSSSLPRSFLTSDTHSIETVPRDWAQVYAHDHDKTLELLRIMEPTSLSSPTLVHPIVPSVPQPNTEAAQATSRIGRYMHPFVAFELFCRKPATPTDEIDKMLFPPNEWAEILDNGDIRCNVKGEITQKGRAEWKDHESSCGHLLRCRDSYRRHLLHSHLGIRREDGKRQKEWIEKRWHEAMQYE